LLFGHARLDDAIFATLGHLSGPSTPTNKAAQLTDISDPPMNAFRAAGCDNSVEAVPADQIAVPCTRRVPQSGGSTDFSDSVVLSIQ
jgi:hypothetical protein